MTYILKLIRWKNLLLIILAQALIKYALLEPLKISYGFDTALTNLGFILLVFSTVCIAAAGYIINDIEDVEADKINKPNKVIIGKHISETNATYLFIALNVIGIIAGYFISNAVEKSNFVLLFILTSGLLYIYSTYLKKITLIGNLVVASLVSFSILLVGICDLVPAMNETNTVSQLFFLDLIKDYAVFAFMLNLFRELVKDIEDIDGDYKIDVKSIPIILGRHRATKLVFVLSLIPLLVIIFYLSNNLYQQPIALGYVLLFIVAPMLYCSIKIYSAEHKKEFIHISTVLKLVMLMGILSLLLFQFILVK
ncbi:geranylgeranylglycerol-phosphate geranylgeranyltransferase [Winogradskyella jejuensis]|uniref:4-hydroxybenzoate polyprenyltransferase n=1 Tax=Winogradskyella jejuensis TaxID=1089305 RepID=A0A1M5V198_9FLAO|nr:geranylgeranylglycerol-phosphate geranylgeranyltransferase [Winogradskyella jejuensis]SHH68703.1 4-hydroxybenzoate polyprenyltransferase [Winogradskyella jejuensis]